METSHEEQEPNVRLAPAEANAVIRLWSRQRWERQHWPTVGDIAEGLEISVPEAEALLREVRTSPRAGSEQATCQRPGWRVCSLWSLTATAAGLTSVFCLFLTRLLS